MPKAKESSKSKTGDRGASYEQRGGSQGRSIQCNVYGHIAKYCKHRFRG